MYVKSNEPGKTWQCCVIRTHRGIYAVAQEGVHETNVGPCNLETFSFAMFGDRKIEQKLDAKRLTAKVEREGLALIAAKAAQVPAIAKAPEGENPEPAQYAVIGDGSQGLFNRDELEAKHGAPAGLTNWHGMLRSELKGRPRFNHLCGPMWGGTSPDGLPIIRYETAEVNAALSA